jgi:hypothetical protein
MSCIDSLSPPAAGSAHVVCMCLCVCVCMYCVGVLAGSQCRSAALPHTVGVDVAVLHCRLLDTVYAIGVGCVCKNSHSLLVCISHRPAVEAVLLCTVHYYYYLCCPPSRQSSTNYSTISTTRRRSSPTLLYLLPAACPRSRALH